MIINREDGSKIKVRQEISEQYRWRPVQEHELYKRWHADINACDFREYPFLGKVYLTREQEEGLKGQEELPSIKLVKTIKQRSVFVYLPTIDDLLRFMRTYNAELWESYNDWHHNGHGASSDNPIPVAAMIIDIGDL